jgi:ATP-dependent exoDNAse (exonuclease V) beta subunit
MQSLFAGIPYTLHLPQEAYYHSLFYMIAVLMGLDVRLEVLTDKGRIDGIMKFEESVYIIEFKYGKAGTDMQALTANALRQIREKKYAEAFQTDPRPCFLVGIGFVDKQIGYRLEQTS